MTLRSRLAPCCYAGIRKVNAVSSSLEEAVRVARPKPI